MPPIGPVIVLLTVFAAVWALLVAVIAHVLIRQFWLACAAVTGFVLLGCVGLHVLEGYRDLLSIAMLYGIGGGAGLAISAAAGLPVAIVRRARDRDRAQ